MPENIRSKLQVVVSEGVVLAVVGLAFYSGIAWTQISDLRIASASHITRVEVRRELDASTGNPERLARLEAQMEQVLSSLRRIERQSEQ